MPATRPSTRIQRRAQPTTSRPSSRQRRTPNATRQPQADTVVLTASDGAAPLAPHPEAEAPTPSPAINDDMLQRIVSAVSQAVLVSINGVGSTTPTPPRSEAAGTELREVPLVESGSTHHVTVPTPVASALDHVTGETNFIQVSPTQPALPTFHSADVPIDAHVNPKIKAKIWAHEFIDFGILLGQVIHAIICP